MQPQYVVRQRRCRKSTIQPCESLRFEYVVPNLLLFILGCKQMPNLHDVFDSGHLSYAIHCIGIPWYICLTSHNPASDSLPRVLLSCKIFDGAPPGLALSPMLYRQRQRIYEEAHLVRLF